MRTETNLTVANGTGTEEPRLTRREVARRLRCDVRTITNYMNERLIPFYRVGRKVWFLWSEIQVATRPGRERN